MSLLSCIAYNRKDGKIISALYNADRSIVLSETNADSCVHTEPPRPDGSAIRSVQPTVHSSSSTKTRAFDWFLDTKKEVVGLSLSDDGSVLALLTADISLYLCPVGALLAAGDDGQSQAGRRDLVGSVYTPAGLPSLQALAKNSETTAVAASLAAGIVVNGSNGSVRGGPARGDSSNGQPSEEAYDGCAVFVPLAAQLGLDTLSADATARETPTTCAWWCPSKVVIDEELQDARQQRMRDERGHDDDDAGRGTTSADRIASDRADDDFQGCEGRYLLIGHGSGRLTLVDLSSHARHIVWSTLLDPGHAIRDLSLFSDLHTLRSHGIWKLPKQYYTNQPASSAKNAWDVGSLDGNDDANDDDDQQTMDSYDSAVLGPFPAPLSIPDCSVVIKTDQHYFRLTLEKAHPSPMKDRRAAAEVAKAVAVLASPQKSRPGSRGAKTGGSTTAAQRRGPEALELPEPKWTRTLLDATGEAAVAALVERTGEGAEGEDDSLRGKTATSQATAALLRPGFVYFVPISKPAAAAAPSQASSDSDKKAEADSKSSSSGFSIFSIFSSSSSQSAVAPEPPAPIQRRKSIANLFGLMGPDAADGLRGPRVRRSANGHTMRVLPGLPARVRVLSSSFQPLKLQQSPSRCDMTVQVSERLKKCVIAVFYFASDDKLLIFEPSLGSDPLYEMLMPMRWSTQKTVIARITYARIRSRLLAPSAMEMVGDADASKEQDQASSDNVEGSNGRAAYGQPYASAKSQASTTMVTIPQCDAADNAEQKHGRKDDGGQRLMLVRATYIVYADGLIFIGENGVAADADAAAVETASRGAADSSKQQPGIVLADAAGAAANEAGDAPTGAVHLLDEQLGVATPTDPRTLTEGTAGVAVTSGDDSVELDTSIERADGAQNDSTTEVLNGMDGGPSNSSGSATNVGIPARVYVVSANLATRACRDAQQIANVLNRVSKGLLAPGSVDGASQPETSAALPSPSSLSIPLDAVLQTFELPVGVAITGLKKLMVPQLSDQGGARDEPAKRDSAAGASSIVAVFTTHQAFGLVGADVRDGAGLIRRMVNEALAPLAASQPAAAGRDVLSSPSKAPRHGARSFALTSRFAAIERLAFALSITVTDVYQSMADDMCGAVAEMATKPSEAGPAIAGETAVAQSGNAGQAIAATLSSIIDKRGPTVDIFASGLPTTAPSALALEHGPTTTLLRAYVLFTLSNASPIKAVLMLCHAGRPDMAVSFALVALGSSLETCDAVASLPQLHAPAPLSPADRTRVANLLIQAQILAAAMAAVDDGDVEAGGIASSGSFALSRTGFKSWLAANKDYVPDRAVNWLVASGMVLEALIVGHERGVAGAAAAANVLQSSVLTRVLNAGAALISGDDECLRYVGSNGYAGLLLEKGSGAFLECMTPEHLCVLLTAPSCNSCSDHDLPPESSLVVMPGLMLAHVVPVLPALASSSRARLLHSLRPSQSIRSGLLGHFFNAAALEAAASRDAIAAQLQLQAVDFDDLSVPATSALALQPEDISDSKPGRHQALSALAVSKSLAALSRAGVDGGSADTRALLAAQDMTELYLSLLLLDLKPAYGFTVSEHEASESDAASLLWLSSLEDLAGWYRPSAIVQKAVDFHRPSAAADICDMLGAWSESYRCRLDACAVALASGVPALSTALIADTALAAFARCLSKSATVGSTINSGAAASLLRTLMVFWASHDDQLPTQPLQSLLVSQQMQPLVSALLFGHHDQTSAFPLALESNIGFLEAVKRLAIPPLILLSSASSWLHDCGDVDR